MFTGGFEKVAAVADIVPRDLRQLTGSTAADIFGRPLRRFGRMGRPRPLVSLSRIRDGLA